MIDKSSREWEEYTDDQKKLREAVEFIVSTMSDEDKRYYCYTIAYGAGYTRFHFFCTHLIFEDFNLNIDELDISWVLCGKSGICRDSKTNPTTHANGIDYAFLLFITILNSMHLKDLIKIYYAVNGRDIPYSLENIRDMYEGKYRISDEAHELIQKGETVQSICDEALKELDEIESHGGFNL